MLSIPADGPAPARNRKIGRHFRPGAVALLASALVVSTCAPSRRVDRQLVSPDRASESTLDRKSEFLKVHLRNGHALVLRSWSFPAGRQQVAGVGHELGINREIIRMGAIEASIDSVVLFETNVLRRPGPATALTVLTVGIATVGVLCLTNPKACFGSCPTFYAGNGDRILAEGFSSSIAPPFEATDIDRLELPPTRDSTFELRMTNEALETHVVRSARLLAFEHVPGSEIAWNGREFWRFAAASAPECTSPDGDCTGQVAAQDDREWFSRTDSTDLAAREELVLRFDVAEGGDYGLVLRSRQTLVHTYVLYQALAYLGLEAGHWLAGMQRGDGTLIQATLGLGRAMGGIEVLDGPGDGRQIANIYETGPLAADTRLIPIGSMQPGQRVLRLRLARGHWRIDRVALVRLQTRVQPITLEPVSVSDRAGDRPDARAALLDPAATLTTLPGDEYRLRFRLPRSARGLDLFLEARGYYLEWMRSEWIAEQNAERARLLLFEPERGLRMIAPEFKKWEPRVEELFWNSRYVRR